MVLMGSVCISQEQALAVLRRVSERKKTLSFDPFVPNPIAYVIGFASNYFMYDNNCM